MNAPMKRTGLGLAFAALLAAGEVRAEDSAVRSPAENDAAPHARLASPDADNTTQNERDRDGLTKTPTDQGNSRPDVTLAAKIRQDVLADKSLSMNAHNVKIIVENGGVTLRGPVETERERSVIQEIAQRAAGSGTVVNGLEVNTK